MVEQIKGVLKPNLGNIITAFVLACSVVATFVTMKVTQGHQQRDIDRLSAEVQQLESISDNFIRLEEALVIARSNQSDIRGHERTLARMEQRLEYFGQTIDRIDEGVQEVTRYIRGGQQ